MSDKRKGYTKRSNAIHISIWQPEGKSIPDEVARDITEAVDKLVKDSRLLQQVLRT